MEEKLLMRKRLRKSVNHIAWAMIFFAVGIVVLNVLGSFLIQRVLVNVKQPVASAILDILGVILNDLVVVAASVIFISKTEKYSFTALYRKPNMPAKQVFRWVVIGVGAVYATSMASDFVFQILQELLGMNFHEATPSLFNEWYSLIISFLTVAIVAPFCEEAMFRGGIACGVLKYGTWFAAIVSGLLFGLAHGNYVQTFFAMTLGFFATVMIAKTGSIWPGIFMHLTINLIGGINMLVMTMAGNFNPNDIEKLLQNGKFEELVTVLPAVLFTSISGFLIMALIIMAIIFFIGEKNKAKMMGEKLIPTADCGLTAKEKVGVFLTSPVMVIALALFLAWTVARALWF